MNVLCTALWTIAAIVLASEWNDRTFHLTISIAQKSGSLAIIRLVAIGCYALPYAAGGLMLALGMRGKLPGTRKAPAKPQP